MKAFYEAFRENNNQVAYLRKRQYLFKAHFHSSIEIFIIKHGSYQVFSNGKTYTLNDGDIAFFDSFSIHSYDKCFCEQIDSQFDDAVLIIPYSYTEKFIALKNGKSIKNIVINDGNLASDILEICDKFLLNKQSEMINENICKLVLSMIFPHLELISIKEKDDNILIKKILMYANDNFRKDITLSTLANDLGYSEAHLSRIFHCYFNDSFANYVNSIRLNYIEKERIKNPNKKITSLLFEAGFNSIQTYYRCKNKNGY